jgi:hypothetical protein
MEHVVFFTGPDGGSHFRRTTELEEAVRFVEHLRNVEGVEDSKVYALNEVPMNFRAYYRVEVNPDLSLGEEGAGGESAAAGLVPDPGALTDAAAAAFAEAQSPAAAPPPPAAAGEPAEGDGPRSLSFFSG